MKNSLHLDSTSLCQLVLFQMAPVMQFESPESLSYPSSQLRKHSSTVCQNHCACSSQVQLRKNIHLSGNSYALLRMKCRLELWKEKIFRFVSFCVFLHTLWRIWDLIQLWEHLIKLNGILVTCVWRCEGILLGNQ